MMSVAIRSPAMRALRGLMEAVRPRTRGVLGGLAEVVGLEQAGDDGLGSAHFVGVDGVVNQAGGASAGLVEAPGDLEWLDATDRESRKPA
jgi:hypothetical protein